MGAPRLDCVLIAISLLLVLAKADEIGVSSENACGKNCGQVRIIYLFVWGDVSKQFWMLQSRGSSGELSGCIDIGIIR